MTTNISGADFGGIQVSDQSGTYELKTWDLAGSHGINKYIWHLLQTELGWVSSDYNGMIPIITPQQQQEFNALSKPYIVYSYSMVDTNDDFFIEREMGAYTIFSPQEGDIRRVVNLLRAKLNKRDESAQEVNAYLSAFGSVSNKEFDYKVISVPSAHGAYPSDQAGGWYDGTITTRIVYTHYGSDGLSIRY